MTTAEYLDRLLTKYSNTFDIYKPYRIGGEVYPAYGYFRSHNEKYILVQEANMWTMDSFEHVLFWEVEEITDAVMAQAGELICRVMEERFVRRGEKNPPKNHMASILTVALITAKAPSKEIQKRIRHFHFDKGYRFHIRGYCRGRIVAASMENEVIVTCAQGTELRKMYQEVFPEVREQQEGFTAACIRQGVEPFRQED